MIAYLKPYPTMKDSGVPWLGEVPTHWNTRPLKRWVTINAEVLSETTAPDRVFRYVDIGSVGTGTLIQKPQRLRFAGALQEPVVLSTRATHSGFDRQNLPEGNLLRHGRRRSSMLDRVRSPHVPCRYGSTVCELPGPKQRIHGSSYSRLCRDSKIRRLLRVVSAHFMSNSTHPEQAAIVRYLDHADRRIQRYIRAKQKLVTLLEEQKQAIIHQAVTGQIDVRTGRPYPAYKPSGVEWLGEVPKHWKVRKLRQCGSVSGGMTPSMDVRRFWGGLVPWVTPKDMKQAVISDSSVRTTNSAVQETSLRLIEPPAVLIVVRGMILARRVPIACTAAPVTINQDMKALRTVKGMNAAFLARSLDSAQEAFIPLIDEAGHGTRRLPMERWRELVITIPPEEEQAAIVEYLDNTTADIDSVIDHTRHQINLLQEYRTRLIADVVTGKLDVREAAARLPDEVEEPEPLDETDALIDGKEEPIEDLDAATEEATV